jgi:hypothetical protein
MDNFFNDDGIVIESTNNNFGGGFQFGGNSDGYNLQGSTQVENNQFGFNASVGNMGMGGSTGFGGGFQEEVDDEERERRDARQKEEAVRRERITNKMNKELEEKQAIKKKAIEWIETTNSLYFKNIATKKDFNKTNETDFLQNRNNNNNQSSNPWDVVTKSIDLKESDYKGSKDVARMRNVIQIRKADFVNLKMK